MDDTAPLHVLLLSAQRDLYRLLAEALAPLGVTPAQAEVLGVLSWQQPLSLRALGARVVCETGSPSRLADGLVRAGLVERRPSASDARQVELRLTVPGSQRAAQVAAAEAEFEAELGGLLPGTPVVEARRLLWRLVALLPSAQALRLRYAAGGHAGPTQTGSGLPYPAASEPPPAQ